MTKREFLAMQKNLFGGKPMHSDLVKRGIVAARAAGVVWGRPRKEKRVA